MPTTKELIEELGFLSEEISGKIWKLSAGVLALCWAFFVTPTQHVPPGDVVGPAVLAVFSMGADLGQYAAGLGYNMVLLRRLERDDVERVEYRRDHPLYRLRQALFFAKTAACLAGCIWLIVVLARVLVTTVG